MVGEIVMKQFNLDEYLKNPDRHIVTRKGIDAKIICTDGSNKTYPIFALIQNGEGKDVLSFTNEGMNTEGYESSFDLFFAPEQKEGWVNLFKINSTITTGEVYNTKEEAKSAVINSAIYISTVKVEWEE